MTPEARAGYDAALLSRLSADPDVLGLVFLGSSAFDHSLASGEPPPDRFSDHDLFVVTASGAQERFRADPSWLPAPIAHWFRETAHGLKVLHESGHLVELAVFDLEELALAKVNRYRVVLDRADVAERLARVRRATRAAQSAPDPAWHMGQLLCELVIGAGRAARGEHLSAHHRIRVQALDHLLVLARERLSPAERAVLDDLDLSRRVEQALPELARDLTALLELPLPAAARALLVLAARERPDLVPPSARAAVERALAQLDS